MSVRHVHASPGEYIAVHRQHGSNGGGSGSGDECGKQGWLATGIRRIYREIVTSPNESSVRYLEYEGVRDKKDKTPIRVFERKDCENEWK